MTIDEVIEREQYSAEANREMADTYHTDENIYLKEEEAFRNREDYHRQLAEWLKELKAYREAREEIGCLPIVWEEGAGIRKCIDILDKHLMEVNADGKSR